MDVHAGAGRVSDKAGVAGSERDVSLRLGDAGGAAVADVHCGGTGEITIEVRLATGHTSEGDPVQGQILRLTKRWRHQLSAVFVAETKGTQFIIT